MPKKHNHYTAKLAYFLIGLLSGTIVAALLMAVLPGFYFFNSEGFTTAIYIPFAFGFSCGIFGCFAEDKMINLLEQLWNEFNQIFNRY